jgi:predicted nucleotidyltransferase
MAPRRVPEGLRSVLSQYIKDLDREIGVEKAYLFGSYAKGKAGNGSDIDIAVFSNRFDNESRIDAIRYLLKKAAKYGGYDLQPVGYGTKKLRDSDDPLISEILNTGIDITAANVINRK